LPEHVAYVLQEAGYSSLGELAVQMKIDKDHVLRLQGIGPRAMINIETLMTSLDEQLIAEEEAARLKALEPVIEVPAEPVTVVVEQPEGVEPVVVESEPLPVEEEKLTVEPVKGIEIDENASLEEIFTLRPEVLDTAVLATDEDETEDSDKSKKKGKKKSKHVVVTYDPDKDLTMVTKQHKRGDSDWGWEE
jgi:N utilization substance protein A